MANKLCLGTAQFGLNYGIGNFSGKPAKESVFAMMDEALKQEIAFFDTASVYGDAETLLGEYKVSEKNVKVISKCKPNLIDGDFLNPEEAIEGQIIESLERLGLKTLDGYLLHEPENFYNARIIRGLQLCKEKGLIKNFGVSIYETQHALDVVRSGLIDYIQVPYSVIDRRLDKTDFFELAEKNKVTVFARSIFLQGLILMEDSKIPAHLAQIKSNLKIFDQILIKYNITRIQAAFAYAYTHPGINYVVFGVDTLDQLKEYVKLSRNRINFDECRDEINNNLGEVSKEIVTPSLWKK